MKTVYDFKTWVGYKELEKLLETNDSIKVIFNTWIEAHGKKERTALRKHFRELGYKVEYQKCWDTVILRRVTK